MPRCNVVDLLVGFTVGAAFATVAKSLVDEMTIEFCVLESPVGTLHVYARDGVLALISFGAADALVERRFGTTKQVRSANPGGAADALRRYFAGDIRCLDALPADPGGTEFQAHVWRELRKVPPGSTISYRELAARIGKPSAVRAVGAANGANPIPIVIPCHRVIGARGTLVGYGGGVPNKDWLLRHEGWRPLAP